LDCVEIITQLIGAVGIAIKNSFGDREIDGETDYVVPCCWIISCNIKKLKANNSFL